jgi:hypothetical protein
MRKIALVFTAMVFAAGLAAPFIAHAADTDIAADKAAIKAQHETMKEHAEAARAEEKEMRGKIKEAAQSGDKEKAKTMRQELRKTHRENVQQRHEDKKAMHDMKKDLRQDRAAMHSQAMGGGKK